MKKIVLLGFLALTAVTVRSQVFQWVETPPIIFSMNHDLIGYPVAADASGNIFMAGFKDSSFPYGSVILGNTFYNKYTPDGTLLFSKTIDGNVGIFAMVSDGEGNILIAAGYHGNIATGNLNLTTVNQGIEPILLKFDTNGNLLWHYIPEIEDGFVEHFKTLTVDAANNIYIGYDNYMDSYIMKLSAAGVPDFTILETQVNTVTSVSVDNAGNIYAVGSCANANAVYAGVSMPIPDNFQYNTYLAKYSPEGTFQWVKYVEDITCPDPIVKAKTPDAIYFSSNLFGPFAFGDITAEGPALGAFTDFFLAKLNADGEYQWVREVPGDGNGIVNPGNRNYIDVDASGNVYYGGNTARTINWDSDTTTTTEGFGNYDTILLKYDPLGNILMAKTAGGESHDRIDAIATNEAGDLFVTGMAHGNASFDNIEITNAGTGYYPFIAKIDSVILGMPEAEAPTMALYPNPTTGNIYVSNLQQSLHGWIYNALGQQISPVETNPGSPIDVSALSNGIYFLKADNLQPMKFVKN